MTVNAIVEARNELYGSDNKRVYTRQECNTFADKCADASREARKRATKYYRAGDSVNAEAMRTQADAYEAQARRWREAAKSAPIA